MQYISHALSSQNYQLALYQDKAKGFGSKLQIHWFHQGPQAELHSRRAQRKQIWPNLNDFNEFDNSKQNIQRVVYVLHVFIFLSYILGLLLVFGAFLAFETRQVSVPALNDSKFIGKIAFSFYCQSDWCLLSAQYQNLCTHLWLQCSDI